MKKLMIITLIISFLTISYSVNASWEAIYPLENSVIGGQYSYQFSNLTPYLNSVYDFKNGKIYYQLGTIIKQNQQLSYQLNYGLGAEFKLPSYTYKQGFNEKLTYNHLNQDGLTQKLEVELFQGRVGEEFTPQNKTAYINLSYNQQLFYNWNNKADLILDITSGYSDSNYYISNLELPLKYNNFIFTPKLGYIKQGDLITPNYDLANSIIGYKNYNQQKQQGEQGTKLAAIKIEKTFNLFPYTTLPVLNLLNAVTFVTAGDVIEKSETINDFELHSSMGGGLALNLGKMDLRLERVITNQGEWQTLFHTTFVY